MDRITYQQIMEVLFEYEPSGDKSLTQGNV